MTIEKMKTGRLLPDRLLCNALCPDYISEWGKMHRDADIQGMLPLFEPVSLLNFLPLSLLQIPPGLLILT